MKLIVAVDNKWGIGKDGDLLLSIPDDMKFFREKTRRAVLVMGYNTLISFPGSKPLPGRMNIVLNNEPGVSAPGTVICGSMEQLFGILADMNSDDVFVIGGGSIYRQLLPYCDTAYITKMRFDGEADTYIPDLDALSEWNVVAESDTKVFDGIEYSFVEYRNSKPLKVGFTGADIDFPAYFAGKKELSFDMSDVDDEGYKKELAAVLRAYFKPLSGGVTAADVESSLDGYGGSFEDYLKENGCIAGADDIARLTEKYGGEKKNVTVAKEQLEDFIESL